MHQNCTAHVHVSPAVRELKGGNSRRCLLVNVVEQSESSEKMRAISVTRGRLNDVVKIKRESEMSEAIQHGLPSSSRISDPVDRVDYGRRKETSSRSFANSDESRQLWVSCACCQNSLVWFCRTFYLSWLWLETEMRTVRNAIPPSWAACLCTILKMTWEICWSDHYTTIQLATIWCLYLYDDLRSLKLRLLPYGQKPADRAMRGTCLTFQNLDQCKQT